MLISSFSSEGGKGLGFLSMTGDFPTCAPVDDPMVGPQHNLE